MHTTPTGVPATAMTTSNRLRQDGWYFAVTIFSAGFLAAIPFWHAARRLRRGAVRKLALVYTAVGVYLVVLMAVIPPQHPDGTSGSETLSTIGGLSVLAVVITACVQLRSLRREAYGQQMAAAGDPAVARALAARTRREEARRLAESDPALARELGIGRPDLRRGYNDGGLIHLNTAPAEVFAYVCGMS
jgi:hypothetical protein